MADELAALGVRQADLNRQSLENSVVLLIGASAAALNSLNKTLAVDQGKRGLTFVVLHPGYVQTDMNNGQGQITPTESAAGLYTVISGLGPEDNGGFYDYNGKVMPW